MNPSDTQQLGKQPGPALISPSESQLFRSQQLAKLQGREEAAGSGPPALSATPTLHGLLQALKRRWALGFGLALLASVLMGLAVFSLMPPKYLASIRIRVVARQPGPEDIEFPIFKANMEALVKSPLVLNAALNDKTADGTRDTKDLDIVRSKGMGAIEWLEKALKTDYILGPEVLRVNLAGDNPAETADLLNAIVKAFLNEYTQMERDKKQLRLAELRSKKERIEEELRRLRNMRDIQEKQLDVKDREALNVVNQQLMHKLAAAETIRRANEDAISKAESEIITHKARLKNLDKAHVPDKVLFEIYSRETSLMSLGKRIADLQEEIDRVYRDYNEPFASQKATVLRYEKLDSLKQKEQRENQLRPEIEKKWRAAVREELTELVAIGEERVAELTRVRDRLAKEIVEVEMKIKNVGTTGKSPTILATEEKIELERLALNHIAQKISEVEAEALPSRVQVLQRAVAPTTKDRSQQTKLAGAGGLGVFVMALFGVAFLEFRSRRITAPEEVVSGLGVPVLGTIPAKPARSRKPDPAAEQRWENQLQESVDAVRTVLQHQARAGAMHVVMVTSAQKSEGKTTLATQLAASLARGWKRVLLIDGDLRYPSAHTLFETPQEPGLAEVLRGEVDATDAVRATALSRLWILPAGNGDTHAIQALAQDNVRTLLEKLKQQYDFIIIDTPPVLPVTDTLLIGQHVDAVMFAVLQDVSRAPAIYAAKQKLAQLGVRMLGAVVLGAEPEFNDRTYGYTLNPAAK